MHSSRRQLLKAAGWTALSYSRVLGANDRIRIGGIGTGGRGSYILNLVKQNDTAEIVALCDVYARRLSEARQKLAPDAREFANYPELLAQRDIDAVVIGSPDHWHVPMTLDAVRAGKDVYVEKPVTHTIEEGDRLLKETALSKQVVQVGYQQRSWEHFRLARDIIASGKLGKISLVLSSWYQDYYSRRDRVVEIERDKLDWKQFLGSAPEQPFDVLRFTNWRWFWDFGGGHLTDLYSHFCDVIHWCMNDDQPRTAVASGGNYALPKFQCPDTIAAAYEYTGFQVTHNGALGGSMNGGNIEFRGTNAVLRLNRDGFAVYPEHVVPGERTPFPEPEIAVRSMADGSAAHVRNFLDCVRSRNQPNANLAVAVPAARAAHLGNAAYRKGNRIAL